MLTFPLAMAPSRGGRVTLDDAKGDSFGLESRESRPGLCISALRGPRLPIPAAIRVRRRSLSMLLTGGLWRSRLNMLPRVPKEDRGDRRLRDSGLAARLFLLPPPGPRPTFAEVGVVSLGFVPPDLRGGVGRFSFPPEFELELEGKGVSAGFGGVRGEL